MRNELIRIPEFHIECDFCIIELGKAYCNGYSDKMIRIEDPEEEINLKNCPIWGKIHERKRTN